MITRLDVTTQGARPALGDGPHNPTLSWGGPVAFPVRLTVAADDLGDLQPRSLAHPLGTDGSRSGSRSSGLVVA